MPRYVSLVWVTVAPVILVGCKSGGTSTGNASRSSFESPAEKAETQRREREKQSAFEEARAGLAVPGRAVVIPASLDSSLSRIRSRPLPRNKAEAGCTLEWMSGVSWVCFPLKSLPARRPLRAQMCLCQCDAPGKPVRKADHTLMANIVVGWMPSGPVNAKMNVVSVYQNGVLVNRYPTFIRTFETGTAPDGIALTLSYGGMPLLRNHSKRLVVDAVVGSFIERRFAGWGCLGGPWVGVNVTRAVREAMEKKLEHLFLLLLHSYPSRRAPGVELAGCGTAHLPGTDGTGAGDEALSPISPILVVEFANGGPGGPGSSGPGAGSGSAAPARDELTNRLRVLEDLRHRGLLSEEEYEAKRQEVLAGVSER